MKQLLVSIAFLAIIASMGSALFFMGRVDRDRPDMVDDPKRARSMWISLAIRITLSVCLFICVLLAWKFGLISPTGLPYGT